MAVALTAAGLVAFDAAALWCFAPLAALSCALALVGNRARPGARGDGFAHTVAQTGGAYIALVTALWVVSLGGPATPAAWVLPTLVGLPLIERRVTGSRERKRLARGRR